MPDTQTITLILRWLVVLAMFACAREAWLITKLLENRRFIRIVKKIAVGLIVFAFARLAASIIDNYLSFGVGVLSNVVNYAFYFWILYYFHKQRRRLKSEMVGADGRRRVSGAINDILDEMKYELDKHATAG